MSLKRLNRDFYTTDAYTLAKNLIGKVLVFKGKRYRIVETEAYGGITDKAAHSYQNKRTKRTEIMYQVGGFVYIFLIYGMYYQFNIVASSKGNPEAVLVRALEPLDETEEKPSTNGPGKLCKKLGIDMRHYGVDLVTNSEIYIADDGFLPEIVASKRINVDYAEEDAERLWRFYHKNNRYVSKK